MAALLTSVLDNRTKAAEYIAECAKFGISVLPPDINTSRVDFVKDTNDGNIRFGMAALKNVGRQFIEAIIRERTGDPFSSFENFVERMSASTDINKRQIEALIKAGAFDSLGTYRSKILSSYETIIDNIQQKKRDNLVGQMDMFSMGIGGEDIAPSFEYPDIPEFSMREKLMLEKDASGMYFSGNMMDNFSKHLSTLEVSEISELISTDEESNVQDKMHVKIAGMITSVSLKTTKREERMAFFRIEDKFGEIECIAFPKIYTSFGHEIRLDTAVCIEGTISLKEEDMPRVLVNTIIPLMENAHYKEAPQKQTSAPTETASVQDPRLSVYLSAYMNAQPSKPTEQAAPTQKPTQTPQKQATAPTKIYLRVPDMECEKFKYAKNLVDIFNEGSLTVIFYDSSTKKYSEYSEKMFYSEYAISELKKVLGEENCILK